MGVNCDSKYERDTGTTCETVMIDIVITTEMVCGYKQVQWAL